MDFIGGLPRSKDMDTILVVVDTILVVVDTIRVVVDHLTKYAHFFSLLILLL